MVGHCGWRASSWNQEHASLPGDSGKLLTPPLPHLCSCTTPALGLEPKSAPAPAEGLPQRLASWSCFWATWNQPAPSNLPQTQFPHLANWGGLNRLTFANKQPAILLPSITKCIFHFLQRRNPSPQLSSSWWWGLSWVAGPATSLGPIFGGGELQEEEKQIDSSWARAPPLPAQEQFAFIMKASCGVFAEGQLPSRPYCRENFP